MSRWAMMLPIVARRSPAITTPPGNVAATIVVPCGARSPALPCGSRHARDGSRSGACSAEEVGERRRARASGTPPGSRGSAHGGHWPPFWMNDFTKSSALVSSTSSISSRIASMSSSSASLRSATSVSVGVPRSPPRSSEDLLRLLLLLCHVDLELLAPTSSRSTARSRRPVASASERREQLLGGVAAVQQRADVGLAAAQRVDRGHPLQRLAARAGRRSPSPTTRRRRGRRTSPGSGRGSRPGCPPAGRASRASIDGVVEQPLDPAQPRPAGGRAPSRAGCRRTAGRSAAAWRRPTRGRRGRGTARAA